MDKLSELALEKSAHIIEQIKAHPFNKELATGTLPLDKFAYYIEQDTLYLKDFARSLAMIAARAPLNYIEDFLNFSKGALVAEQDLVHGFFRQELHLQETGHLSPATFSYTSYLLRNSTTATVEVAIATVLPCFWVYNIVGKSIAENTESQNRYWRWIETYSSEEFSSSVERIIEIFDEISLLASDEIKYSMLNAFYISTVLEWHFWNDAYNKTIFTSV